MFFRNVYSNELKNNLNIIISLLYLNGLWICLLFN